jgi:hypothetical protein
MIEVNMEMTTTMMMMMMMMMKETLGHKDEMALLRRKVTKKLKNHSKQNLMIERMMEWVE